MMKQLGLSGMLAAMLAMAAAAKMPIGTAAIPARDR